MQFGLEAVLAIATMKPGVRFHPTGFPGLRRNFNGSLRSVFFTLPNGGAQNKRQISLKVESVASVDSFPGELGFPSSKGVSANMGSFYFS